MIREHQVDTFQFHHYLDIIAEIRMNIAVDVLLLLKDGIVPGDEKQEAKANQPDRPCNSPEEPSYMLAGVEALEAIPRLSSVLMINTFPQIPHLLLISSPKFGIFLLFMS